MDENMEKMNCKLDELKQELSVKVDKVKSECEDKIEKMEMEFNEKVDKLTGELHDVHVQNKELAKTNAGLKEELSRLNNECVNNFRGILKIKQEAELDSLRLTGVPEAPRKRNPETQRLELENTEEVLCQLLQNKMEIDVNKDDLSFAKRLPKPAKQRGSDTPRPILVKFMRNSNRQKVIANRRCLKGTGIGVHEVLTQASKYIFDATKDMAKSVSKVKSVWTWQGVTHVLVDDGQTAIKYRVHSVKNIQDIAKQYADPD